MDPLLSTALEAAEAAAQIHSIHFGHIGLKDAREKGPSDFVSQVDLEAQEAAVGVISRRFPGHRILAEEETATEKDIPEERGWPENGEYLWIIDPLDGTTNFLHGHPQFAASVGVGRRIHSFHDRADATDGSGPGAGTVLEAGSALGAGSVLEAGAVVAPRTGERWWARRGGGAFKNGLPIRVSPVRALASALIGTGFPFKKAELVPRYMREFQRILPASGGVRRGGSAALDLCYLAEGILDAFWEEDYLSPWDVTAGLVILTEAGGLATRLDGSEIDLRDGSILAANSPTLLTALGDLIREPQG